jgi:biopolymer transport protein TolQ
VWSWAIIIDKFFKFRILNIRTNKFKKIFWSGSVLEEIYQKIKNNQTYPSAVIFAAAMQEWEGINVVKIIQDKDNGKREAFKERLNVIMENALTKSLKKIRFGMNFLAIISSSSGVIGFLATSWNLINTFNVIAMRQDTSLSIIAPSIASALFGIILGLFVLIPALIFGIHYNKKINDFEDEMAIFCNDIYVILSKELEQNV